MQPVIDFVNDDMDLDDTFSSAALHEATILSIFRPDRERDAARHMAKFFASKRLPCGSPVPDSMIYTKANFDFVLEGEFVDRLDMIYKELGTFENGESDCGGSVPWDVRFVMDSLKECAKMRIPRNNAIGMILIEARICKTHQGLRKAN